MKEGEPGNQGIICFICAVWHQAGQLNDLGAIGTASTDRDSHSEKPINPLVHRSFITFKIKTTNVRMIR